MPLLAHYGRLPLADVRTFSPSLLQGLLYGLLIGGLFALYAAAFAQVRQGQKRLSLPQLLLAAVLGSLMLWLPFLPVAGVVVQQNLLDSQTMQCTRGNCPATADVLQSPSYE